jgi:hypothetical protein
MEVTPSNCVSVITNDKSSMYGFLYVFYTAIYVKPDHVQLPEIAPDITEE